MIYVTPNRVFRSTEQIKIVEKSVQIRDSKMAISLSSSLNTRIKAITRVFFCII